MLKLPHLLFYGPPGTGKTTSILAIAHELFGPEVFRSRVLELNASDERGISIVRSKIKNFAQLAVSKDPNLPSFKIIVLDEADAMTKDAQSALRRTMEQYSRVTRFCLICNYVTKIIDPIASRCAKFRFKPLASFAITERLRGISLSEGLDLDDDAFQALCKVSRGDLRKAINLLQSLKLMSAMMAKSGLISQEDVWNVSGQVPDYVIDDFLAYLRNSQGKGVVGIEFQVQQLITSGYDVSQLLSGIQMRILSMPISDISKSDIAIAVAKADRALSDGADEYLQLLHVASIIYSQ